MLAVKVGTDKQPNDGKSFCVTPRVAQNEKDAGAIDVCGVKERTCKSSHQKDCADITTKVEGKNPALCHKLQESSFKDERKRTAAAAVQR